MSSPRPLLPPSCDPTAIERIPVAGPTLTASALASLPAHVRRRLEGALASGLVTASSPPSALRAALGSGHDQHPDDIFAGLRQLEALGITGRAAAAWLRTTAQATRPARPADLVWSGPGAARPTVYYDARSLDPDGPAGVLHAKAVVADDESVFVTSANLTEAALDRNIELGLLVRDRPLALKVAGHFRGLIERGLLARLPE